MSDRFELEEQIMRCWAVVDDIDLLYRRTETEMTQDELANFLLGLKTIYQAKFEEMFSTFEKMISSGQIASKQKDADDR